MASECCLSLTKYFLFLFNLIFCLLGSFLLSMGLWILLSGNTELVRPPSYLSFYLFSYLLIISGSVTMSLGFFGCLGSLKTVKCLLATYFILLTVLLAAQIVGGVLFYTQKSEVPVVLEEHTLKIIKSLDSNDSSYKSFEKTIDDIQQKAKCCGWNGKQDWKNSIPCSCYYKSNATVNVTYPIKDINCKYLTCSLNDTCGVYTQGCGVTIEKWLKQNLSIILVVILAIPVVEICGMILSMCLYKEASVNYSTVIY